MPCAGVLDNRQSLIVVAGHSHGVGKTTVIQEILRAETSRRWAAVKVSALPDGEPHETRAVIERELCADPRTQTGRYLIAGAERAFLCRATTEQLPETADFIRRLGAAGFDVIVESNRIVDVVDPDLVLFVVAPRIADWDASSGVALPRTHAFIIRDEDEAAALEAVRALAARGRAGFALGHGDETARFFAWLAFRLTTVRTDGQIFAAVR